MAGGVQPKCALCGYASTTVQPDGIPLLPVYHPVIEAAFMKVPFSATLASQLLVQLYAEMFSARHLTVLSDVQLLNIL